MPSGTPIWTGSLIDYYSGTSGNIFYTNSWFRIEGPYSISTSSNGETALKLGNNRVDGTSYIPRFVEQGWSTIYDSYRVDGRIINVDAQRQGPFSYQAWGEWSNAPDYSGTNPNPSLGIDGIWVIGQNTLPEDMPKAGDATYVGEMMGVLKTERYNPFTGGSTYGSRVSGTLQIGVNFAAKSVGGRYSLPGISQGQIETTTYANSGKSVVFGTNLIPDGTSRTGTINGVFNGPRAEELGGSWFLPGPGAYDLAEGIFEASR